MAMDFCRRTMCAPTEKQAASVFRRGAACCSRTFLFYLWLPPGGSSRVAGEGERVNLAKRKIPFTLAPPCLQVIREVTADRRYKNAALAREVVFEEI